MQVLVKGSDRMPEPTWTDWIRANLVWLGLHGWTVETVPDPEPPSDSEEDA